MEKYKKQNIYVCISFFVPVFIASFIRFWDLDLRPFHADEGVNSNFLLNLYNKNYYHYNPANYHGPFLYYIGLIPFYIFGISDFSFRLMPVLFGIMNVALLYPLRRRLGNMGILTAGLLVALSPAISFFSRDTIHETYLIFFSLSVIVSFFLYSETRKSLYIYFAVSSLAFIITIKETYIITFAVFILSLALAYCYEIAFLSTKGTRVFAIKNILTAFVTNCKQHTYTIGISIGIFLLINFLLFSSFFTYFEGITGILTTLKIWTKTGTHSGGHAKPFIYYFTLLRKFELPILVMGIMGFYYAFRQGNKFTTFLSFWTIFIYVIYSFIPYKTPWLIVNILLPLSIMGGIFIHGVFKTIRKKWHYVTFYSLYVCIFGFFAYQSILLNFVNYDDERYELVYVQTKRDIYNLIDRVESLAKAYGNDLTINIASKSYWPLPWYFRNYKNAQFWGRTISNPNAPIILVDKNNEAELNKRLKSEYVKERFVLRPGVWITAYFQEGLYEAVFGKKSTKKEEDLPIIISERELTQGLSVRRFYNIDCIGTPFSSGIEKESISFSYNDETKKPYRSPFAIEWEGYLSVPRKGLYQFATRSDDGSEVYIDNKLVVDNGGPHALRYISGIVPLDAGFHALRIKYFDIGGGAVMEFLWKPPEENETRVPHTVLFHRK
ncbi:MAG: TIGR03663 family protein [Candidatus Brocadiaceae bacterium]|nr:TIGR03663 family protein [Candidatus Brocadiaceae bacterium]